MFISCDSVYNSVAYDSAKTRLSELEEEAEEPSIVIGLFLCFCFRLRQSSFNYKIVSDRVISRISVLLSNCWFDFRKIVLFYASELVKPALKCLKTFETNVSRKNLFLKMTHTLYYFSICFYSKRSPRDNNGRVINK